MRNGSGQNRFRAGHGNLCQWNRNAAADQWPRGGPNFWQHGPHPGRILLRGSDGTLDGDIGRYLAASSAIGRMVRHRLVGDEHALLGWWPGSRRRDSGRKQLGTWPNAILYRGWLVSGSRHDLGASGGTTDGRAAIQHRWQLCLERGAVLRWV